MIMFWYLLKKQLLLFLRNRPELLLLLGMPLILITILGFALSGVMDGDHLEIDAKVALIEIGSEQDEVDRFINDLEEKQLPSEQKEVITAVASELSPIDIIKNEIFKNEELSSFLSLEEFDENEIEQLKSDDTYAVIIETPENFTYDILNSMFFNVDNVPELNFYVNEGKDITSKIVEDVIMFFQNQLSTFVILGKQGVITEQVFANPSDMEINTETVTKREPVTSLGYYAIGMSVMFVLYIATTIGSYAHVEKESLVFDRIMLANVSRWVYFTSIFCSAVILAFLQLCILYGVVALVYQVTWNSLGAFIAVTLSICFTTGGLAVLMTSLNYRFKSAEISTFFSSVGIPVIAFLGGSMMPISQMPESMAFISKITPNGAGMTAYLKILQGYSLTDVIPSLLTLFSIGIVLLLCSIASFPKRRGAL
ncbi:ABC transporter permease [Bacillus sp. SM2101]|uniref:ABC transporter permease n=1 Tax=Bacillus sp. SM2101 TaxID=2805366 RepID=UPI001BDEDC43|nr:ABC transporter permease [Bacillus sp. SM2101]